jgi:ubiquinol-cytochrome c reductase cytochrome b subunit
MRTAVGLGVFTGVLLVFLAGASDRVDVLFGISYSAQIWVYRVLVFVAPVIVGLIAYRVCIELQKGELVQRERERAEAEADAIARRDELAREYV